MTRSTNARLAGFMFLFYIATAAPGMVLFNKATAGEGVAAKLASIALHAGFMRVDVVLTLLAFVNAVVLGVALYGLTREEDHDIALLALSCRIAEGVINAMSTVVPLGLLWLATGPAAEAGGVGAFLLKAPFFTSNISATCFAVGSALFSWLFLRSRSIPVILAWLGFLGSILLVVALPMELAGVLRGPVTAYMWIPMAVFEVVLGIWLLVTGAPVPRTARA